MVTSRMFPRFLLPLIALIMTAPLHAFDLNQLIVEQIRTMPRSGGYAVTAEAGRNLRASVGLQGERLVIQPQTARPSYCSGATYLVLLKALEELEKRRAFVISPEAKQALLIRGQADGAGIWGRWNANGPGTPRLFHELKLGRNFESYSEARPGDFMKIFWTDEVGKLERGHSVIFLGEEVVKGVDSVRFWSSNQPDGYGVKVIPKSKIAWAIFSRLEHPERMSGAAALPKSDPYLASLLKVRSSRAEVRSKCGMKAVR